MNTHLYTQCVDHGSSATAMVLAVIMCVLALIAWTLAVHSIIEHLKQFNREQRQRKSAHTARYFGPGDDDE